MPPKGWKKGKVPLTEEQMKALAIVQRVAQIRQSEQLHFYKPQSLADDPPGVPQYEFHHCDKRRILVHGGNRAGKNVAIVPDLLWVHTGQHPARQWWEPPIYGRWCGTGMNDHVLKVLVEGLKRTVPKEWLEGGEWHYSHDTRMVKFAERGPGKGGWIEFMSYDQDPTKGSGRPLHYTWFDESYDCHEQFRQQCLSRLRDYRGFAIASLCPEFGDASWEVEWYERGHNGDPDYAVFQFETDKNRYLPKETVDDIIRDANGDEIQIRIRLKGEFVSIGTLIYGLLLKPEMHFLDPGDFGVTPDWTKYVDVDPGINKDHFVTWHVVGPGKRVFFYRELLMSGTMEEMMMAVREKGGTERLAAVNFDPHWNWNNQTVKSPTGTAPFNLHSSLRDAMDAAGYTDVPLVEARRDRHVHFGIDQVKALLAKDSLTGKPNLAISRVCPVLWKQMNNYKFVRTKAKDPDAHHPKVRKVDDDGPDCVRIAVTSPMEYLYDDMHGVVISEVIEGEYGLSW